MKGKKEWKRRVQCALCLLGVCTLLCGCQSREGTVTAQITLPPAQVKQPAPENDGNQGYEQTVILYLPSQDGAQLVAVPETADFSLSRHRAGAICERLVSHPATDLTAPLGGEVPLTLSEMDAVEVSGQVATVNLGPSALRLSHEQLFTVGQALANTLCQNGDVSYVNLLISGTQPGMNVASTLPAGCFQMNTREELTALWSRASAPLSGNRRSFAAALYFPAPSGKGILCEARTLSFSNMDMAGMAMTLLSALSAGAENLPNMPRCPDFRTYLQKEPALEENAGTRRLTFHFTEDFNGALIDAGITRSVMMASLTYTMTTFLPGIEGIEVLIGQERINTLTPSGIYAGAGEVIGFSEGLMRRRDFASFLLAECPMYFADAGGKLARVLRPVPFYFVSGARAIVEQMMLGPQPFDSVSGLSPVLPEGIRPADLLGVSFSQGTLWLNFSDRLPALCQGMDREAEARMIYGLVNTLCEVSGVKRVGFFIQGEQPDSLAGGIYLPGDFLPDLDLMR